MGMTLAEKILAAHCDRQEVRPGELINCRVDFVLANDVTAPLAIEQFRKALEIDPTDAVTHYQLGDALAGRGRVDEAIAHFRKALKLTPPEEKSLAEKIRRRLQRYQTGKPARPRRVSGGGGS